MSISDRLFCLLSLSLFRQSHGGIGFAGRYEYSAGNASPLALKPAVAKRGHLYLAGLQQVAEW